MLVFSKVSEPMRLFSTVFLELGPGMADEESYNEFSINPASPRTGFPYLGRPIGSTLWIQSYIIVLYFLVAPLKAMYEVYRRE